MEEGALVREYLRKFFDAASKLKDMGIDVNDNLLTVMLLGSLPVSYENFRCAIESRDDLPTPEALKVKILEESDTRRRNPNENAMSHIMTNWSWIEMCGPGGLVPWYPSKHDVGSCFQQIFLLVPVSILFAVVSAYFYGSRTEQSAFYHQKFIIHLRFTITILITLVPVTRIIVGLLITNEMFRPVDYLTAGVEIIAWFVHAGYVLSLRHEKKINGPVFMRVLWTLLVVLAIISLRSQLLSSHSKQDHVYEFRLGFSIVTVVLQIFYGLTFLLNGKRQPNQTLLSTQFSERTHLLSPSVYQGFREDMDPEYLGVAMDDESCTSKLIFYWVYPLMKKGTEGKLKTCDDLYDLPNGLTSSYVCAKLHSALNYYKKPETTTAYGSTDVAFLPEPERVTLLKALHLCFGVEFYSIGVLKLLSDILGFGGPLLLHRLVSFIEDKNESAESGFLCTLGLFVTTFLGALANVHFNFCMAKVGIKLRGALISIIYRKVLETNYLALNKFSLGEITNFMSTDTDRIVNSCPSFHSFWSIPLQVIVTFYLLYMQVGLAFMAGVVFTVILIPINKIVASKIGKLSAKLMEKKDQRVACMAELLRGIRTLKVQVWEEYFSEKVLRIREQELKHLKGRKYLDAVCVYFWATTPIIISILTFATYSLMGNQLTAATVFTTMALLNMLIAPLNAFPWILNGLTEAWVSLQRIQKLLDTKNNNFKEYFESDSHSEKLAYSLRGCTFDWQGSDDSKDDTDKSEGTFTPKGNALVINDEEAITPWELETESKKHFALENINLTIEEGSFIGVIGPVGSGKSTFLAALIGEIHKSKGQISMKNIESGCAVAIQTPWLQKGTLRENILFGQTYDNTWYKTVLDACNLTQDLETFQNGDLVKIGEGGMTLSGGQRARVALARAVYQNKLIYLLDDILASVDVHVARNIYSKVICGLLRNKTIIWCTNQVQFLTNADFIIRLDHGTIVAAGKPGEVLSDYEAFMHCDTDSLTSKNEVESPAEDPKNFADDDDEKNEIGAIKTKVYKKYWVAVGHFLSFTVLFSIFLMQASRNLADFWLSFWVSHEVKLNSTSSTNWKLFDGSTNYYLTVYLVLAVMNTFITLIRAFLFAYSGIQAAVIIHECLLKKILTSKITFFDISPIGRILNRFSSDTYAVDDSLPFILNILLAQFFGLLGSIVITTYGLPWLCLLLAPLLPVYHSLQATYRAASRELKRLSSTSLSPLYSHFNETLQGLTTIRAFRSLSRFRQINEEYLENNQKAVFASQAANQWFGFRLQMIGVMLVTGVGVISVLQHEFDIVDSAIVGLTISYALSMTSLLNGIVCAFTETEKEMISLERIGQYMDEVESEPETKGSPPYGWPSQGVIVFQSVYLKYREHIPPSLNGVSFETRPAEKIGVVGRTGAGKSSLIVALFRLVNISHGKILIDTVNVNQISLQSLRSRISVIPQDPFLFEGTFRDNVDPLREFNDLEIWSALQKCHLKDLVENLGGLGATVSTAGRNLSQGQKQLLCLVRAVLQSAKIVCIDEATAFVDSESDKKIQHTIRSCFRQSTVLTIAHRISTIMDCDRILVLSDGEVVEFDSPKTLALDETSHFFQLRQQEIH